MKSLLVLTLALASFNVSAIDKNLEHRQKVSLYVSEYFNKKNFTPIPDDDCKNRIGHCVDAVCDQLGAYGCDRQNEMDEVLVWCRGNYDGGCVKTACNYLGTFGCDQRDEVQEIARACVGNFGGDCVVAVCERLGSFGCDRQDEVLDVIRKCAGN